MEEPEQLSDIHCQDDLSAMVISGCESLLGLKSCELKVFYSSLTLKSHWVVLVIPDTCSRIEIKSWLNTLFHHCHFSAVLLVQVGVYWLVNSSLVKL